MGDLKTTGLDSDIPGEFGRAGTTIPDLILAVSRSIARRWYRWRVRRETVAALDGLDGRMLRDIGIRRAAIGSVATDALGWDVAAPLPGNDNAPRLSKRA